MFPPKQIIRAHSSGPETRSTPARERSPNFPVCDIRDPISFGVLRLLLKFSIRAQPSPIRVSSCILGKVSVASAVNNSGKRVVCMRSNAGGEEETSRSEGTQEACVIAPLPSPFVIGRFKILARLQPRRLPRRISEELGQRHSTDWKSSRS